MAQCWPGAIERLRLLDWHLVPRIQKFEEVAVGGFAEQPVSLVAHGVALAAFDAVVVIVEHFLERPLVNNGLVTLEARPLPAFKSFDGDGSKFDSLDGAPRLGIESHN